MKKLFTLLIVLPLLTFSQVDLYLSDLDLNTGTVEVRMNNQGPESVCSLNIFVSGIHLTNLVSPVTLGEGLPTTAPPTTV